MDQDSPPFLSSSYFKVPDFMEATQTVCELSTNVHACLLNRYNFIPRIQRVSGKNMENKNKKQKKQKKKNNIHYQANHNEGGGSIPFL